MVAVEFKSVSKRFSLQHDRPRSFQEWVVNLFRGGQDTEEFWALRDVSFQVCRGEAVAFVGANGAGKSSLLKLVNGILAPTSGIVTVNGRISGLLELGAGFHPDLTGRENVYLNGSILGLDRRELDRQFPSIVRFAELDAFIDMPIKHYSSGMHMRLGFSVAIHAQPDILLVDEVLAVGDAAFQTKCMSRIIDLKKRGVTIMLVSHDLDSVRKLCDRAFWIENSRIQVEGAPGKVIAAYLDHVAERQFRETSTQGDKYTSTQGHRETSTQGHRDTGTQGHRDTGTQGSRETKGQEGAGEWGSRGVGEPGSGGVGEQEANPQSSILNPQSSILNPQSSIFNLQSSVFRLPEAARWGTREVEITGVEFLTAEGTPAEAFDTGETLVARIHYLAHQRIEHPMFGVAIHHEEGAHVSGPNTVYAGYDIPVIEGRGWVDYIIKDLPLLAGTYIFTAAIYDQWETAAYDHHDKSYAFRVRPGHAERYGLMTLTARWKHEG